MKRIIAALIALSLTGWWLTAQAAQPSAGTTLVQVYHGDDSVISYSGTNNAAGRTDALRRALAYAKMFPTSRYLVLAGYGQFAITDHGLADGGPLLIPGNVTLRGMGRGETMIWSNKQIDKDTGGIHMGPAVCLNDGSVVEDLSVVDECYNPGEDAGAIGVNDLVTDASVTLRRCNFKASDWPLYCWSPRCTFRVTECDIYTGRVGFAMENSGDGQTLIAERCKVYGDATWSKSQGETSNRNNGGVFGAVCRGGLARFVDCEFQLKGQDPNTGNANGSFAPRICGIVDRGGGNTESGRAVIEVYNLRCSITPNGADVARCFDLNLEFPYVQAAAKVNWANCWGMSADNTLKRSW